MSSESKSLKITVIASTCHYYQVPLFREMAKHPRIQLKVFYCSEEALKGGDVQRWFNTKDSWGVENELLHGYDYEFMKNYSPKPSYINSFTGLMNFGVWNKIRKEKPDAVILMSWMNPTWWIAILACIQFRIPFFMMTDANVAGDRSNVRWKKWVKSLALGRGLFRFTSGFLCAGTANRKLFLSYGVPEEKLLPFAYSWGYSDLIDSSVALRKQKMALRDSLGISQKSKVVLFCGRLNHIKRPFDLLDAFKMSTVPDKALVFVGDGEMASRLKSYVSETDIPSVYFFGFQNRNEIGKFYAAADVLALPSIRETWGLVVNEAMCFGLPIIVSDQVGSNDDLLFIGENGYTFPPGDIAALSDRIDTVLGLPEEQRAKMGDRSREIISSWAQRDLPEALVEFVDQVRPGGPVKDPQMEQPNR